MTTEDFTSGGTVIMPGWSAGGAASPGGQLPLATLELALPQLELLGPRIELPRALFQHLLPLPQLLALTPSPPATPVPALLQAADALLQLRLALRDLVHSITQRLLEVLELTEPLRPTAIGLARAVAQHPAQLIGVRRLLEAPPAPWSAFARLHGLGFGGIGPFRRVFAEHAHVTMIEPSRWRRDFPRRTPDFSPSSRERSSGTGAAS